MDNIDVFNILAYIYSSNEDKFNFEAGKFNNDAIWKIPAQIINILWLTPLFCIYTKYLFYFR